MEIPLEEEEEEREAQFSSCREAQLSKFFLLCFGWHWDGRSIHRSSWLYGFCKRRARFPFAKSVCALKRKGYRTFGPLRIFPLFVAKRRNRRRRLFSVPFFCQVRRLCGLGAKLAKKAPPPPPLRNGAAGSRSPGLSASQEERMRKLCYTSFLSGGRRGGVGSAFPFLPVTEGRGLSREGAPHSLPFQFPLAATKNQRC